MYSYRPEHLTPDVWDYVFMNNAPYPKNCKIPKELVEKMRREFRYWYPVDLRCSGKDLIQNHLTFFIYNHCAIWPDETYWPKGIRANGHLLLNSAKVNLYAYIYLVRNNTSVGEISTIFDHNSYLLCVW